MFEYYRKKIQAATQNACVKCLLCYTSYLLWLLEKCIKFITKNAYIQVALTNKWDGSYYTHPRFINASATDHANRSPSALAVERPSSSTRTNDRTVARSKIRAHSRHSTANVLASCEC